MVGGGVVVSLILANVRSDAVMRIVVGAFVTVTVDVADSDPMAALMIVVPTPTPVTTPVVDTVATAGTLLVHTKESPGTSPPAAFVADAASCRVEPGEGIDRVLGATAIDTALLMTTSVAVRARRPCANGPLPVRAMVGVDLIPRRLS